MAPRKNYHIGHKKWSNNVTIIQIDFLKNDVSEYHQFSMCVHTEAIERDVFTWTFMSYTSLLSAK